MLHGGNRQNNGGEEHPPEPAPATPDIPEEGDKLEPPPAIPDTIVKMMTDKDLNRRTKLPTEPGNERRSKAKN